MRNPYIVRCALSAIDPYHDPKFLRVTRPHRSPRNLMLRRLKSHDDEIIQHGRVRITKAKAFDRVMRCFPFGVRLKKDSKRETCGLVYWCPYCWARQRTVKTYIRVRNHLLDPAGLPVRGREEQTVIVVRRHHHSFASEVPLDRVRRRGDEFFDWASIFKYATDQFDHLQWHGSIYCNSFDVICCPGELSSSFGAPVWRITPVTSTIAIVNREDIDPMLEQLRGYDHVMTTYTSAASVPDLASVAQQVAIGCRYPVSWYQAQHWPILPDVLKALGRTRLFSSHGCLRRDSANDHQDPAAGADAGTLAHGPQVVRVSALKPNSRFLRQRGGTGADAEQAHRPGSEMGEAEE